MSDRTVDEAKRDELDARAGMWNAIAEGVKAIAAVVLEVIAEERGGRSR